jgi:pimeloyl-ACP methyl ester carboxylesterase
MEMPSQFIAVAGNFDLHYLHWTPREPSSKLPVVCIHGNLSNARLFAWIGEWLASGQDGPARQVVAIDIRGRGDSGLPKQGFTLAHMAMDIESVLQHLGIDTTHMIAYSRGITYALEYVLRNPGTVQGMVIGDHPPLCQSLSPEWAAKMADMQGGYDSWAHAYEEAAANGISREEFDAHRESFYTELNGRIERRYAREFPVRHQQELEEQDLSTALALIPGKLLVLKGTEAGSLLAEDALAVYQAREAEIVRITGAGHDVLEPREQVKTALAAFFGSLD